MERTADPQRWEDACAASHQPTPAFHRYEWLELAAEITDTQFIAHVVVHGGKDVGVVPLLLRRKGPFSLLNWLPFPYVGPLVPASLLGETLDVMRPVTRPYGVVRQQQSFPPGSSVDDAALSARGFSVGRDSTYIVDTSKGEPALWEGLTSDRRRSIRSAQRTGVSIEPAPDLEVLSSVISAVFAARGLKSGLANLPIAAGRFSRLSMPARHAVAIWDGRPVGSMMSFQSESAALIWQGGVLPEYRATNAGAALYWDAIVWASKRGAQTIDLVGLPDAGIARFKSEFGGKLVSYVVTQRQNKLAARAASGLRALRERRAHEIRS